MRSLIVGCGIGAEHHFSSISHLNGIEIVGVCDTDLEKAKAASKKWGIKHIYEDLSEALKSERPDVVHITTPPESHRPLALKAIEYGCHVMLEKPMSVTIDEAVEIIRASKKKGVKLCMVHNHLYDPVILRAKKMIGEGKIGDINYVHIIYNISKKKGMKSIGKRREWMENLPLGVFSEYAPHSIYLMLSFLENTRVVSAVMKTRDVLPESVGKLNIQLAGDHATGNILIFKNMDYGEFSVRIYGTKAALNINVFELTMGIFKERNLPQTAARSLATLEQGAMFLWAMSSNIIKVITGRLKKRPGHLKLIEDFYKSIQNGGEPPILGEQGKAVVEIIEDVISCVGQNVR